MFNKYIFKLVTAGVRQIYKSGYRIFTASVLVSAFHLDHEYVDRILQQLVNKHDLIRIYRVYDPDDDGKHVDYINVNKVPKDKYIYYEQTGEKFFVSRYAEIGIFYKFTSDYIKEMKDEDSTFPKEPNIKKSGDSLKSAIDNGFEHSNKSEDTVPNIYVNQVNITNYYEGGNKTDNSFNFHARDISGKNNLNNLSNKVGNYTDYHNVSYQIDKDLNTLDKALSGSKYKTNIMRAKQAVNDKKYSKAINWLKKIKNVGTVSSTVISVIALISKLSGIVTGI